MKTASFVPQALRLAAASAWIKKTGSSEKEISKNEGKKKKRGRRITYMVKEKTVVIEQLLLEIG